MTTQKKLLGVFGSLIGALIGLVVWCLIGSLGYISAIGGIVICLGAVFGYILLAEDMDAFGAIVSIVIVIATVYLGERITFAMALKKALELFSDNDVSFMKCFIHIDDLLEAVDMKSDYIEDMVKSYIFTAVGGGFMFVKAFK